MWRFVFVILSLLSIFSCAATSPLDGRRVRHYTVDDGLASNAVYSFCQDSKGRMWFGTIDGLHSFDGYNITEWRDDSLPSLGSIISEIREDDKDRLWVGTRNGVVLFDLRLEKFMEIPVNPASGVRIKSPVNSILCDSKGIVWLSTSSEGVFRYDPSTEMLRQYPATSKIPCDLVRPLMEDSNGRLWAGTNEGLTLYNPAQDRFLPIGNPADKISVTYLFEDSRHNLWVGSRGNGLFLFNKEKNVLEPKLTPADSNSLLQVRDIKEWRSGELLLASDQGLTVYNVDSGEVELIRADRKDPDALNDNYLQSLFIDRENGLWIGTYFGGVNYVAPTTRLFSHFNNDNSSLFANMVSVFAPASEGNVWIGSDDAGVFHWNRKTNEFTSLRRHPLVSGSAYKNIHALLQDGSLLFVGMYLGGLDIVDLKTGKLKNYTLGQDIRSLYASSVYEVYRDSYGDIWIGTTGGLNRYCPETDDFERIFEVHPADVDCIVEDNRGYLWAGTTNKGIFRLDRKTGKWNQYLSDSADTFGEARLPSHSVVTAECDSDGNFWIGTDGGGLLRFNYEADKFIKEPLPPTIRVVNKIISHNGRLWLGTSKGLYYYNPQDTTVFSYDKDSGLQGNVFLPNSGMKTADGTVLMGGLNGFNAFNPDMLTPRHFNPEVILVDFRCFNRPVKFGAKDSPLEQSITYSDGITLNHTQRMISFKVVPVSYINPSYNIYSYKLEGFDKDWNESSPSQDITYTNLPAGNYVFRVKTSDGHGGWNEDALVFPIKVLPPWWLSPLMIVLYVVIAVSFMLLLYRRFVNKHQEKLEKLANQKDRELYQSKIDFFTNIVHEIRTPLTLILSPLENLLKKDGSVADCRPQLAVMNRNGKRLLTLVNHLMDFRKMESGAMKLNITDVDIREVLDGICRNYILTAAIKNLEVSVTLPESPCMARVDREAFTQIVNNLLSNALKFAKSEIHISLTRLDNGAFRLSVKNNGDAIPEKEQEKIFTPFYQIADNRPTDNIGTGLGLLLVKRYANLIGTNVEVISKGKVGAEFILDFPPADVSDSRPEDNVGQVDATPGNDAVVETPPEEVAAKERVLVVDDNRDMLDFLNEVLSEVYEVECVENAQAALAAIQACPPDLIVSDVMMPGTDGMEFCRIIKSDILTSHIPVILLTAKVEKSDFVKGFDSGADLYVAKPFSTEVILAQIRGLLVNRARLREKFAADPSAISEIVPKSDIDKEFFDRMHSIIEQRMADADFSVDTLAQELAISRTGLFTKLKSLLGMTPNDYIRLVRLQKAASLLKTTDMRVTEVCWQVGFSSRSHFTKCFQEKYGMSPSEYKVS